MSADYSEPQQKIGVEIETSWIKVTKNTAGKSFSFLTNGGKKLWLLEPDTADSSKEGFNLELKTHLGFGDQNTFLPVLEAMTHVLIEIYSSKTEKLTIPNLQGFLPEKYLNNYSISEEGWSKTGNLQVIFRDRGHITPQITYQLPLSTIPKVFERLAELGHQPVSEFFNVFNSKDFKKPIPPSKEARPKMWAIYHTQLFFTLLRERFQASLQSPKVSENVKGMTYLFLYYWVSLFNDKQPSSDEPGLKPYLAVMSRIPLSELYGHGLSSDEKQQFQNIVGAAVDQLQDHHVPGQLFNNTLRSYKEEKMDSPKLKLKDWYKSIIDPEKYGGEVKKQLDYDRKKKHYVDLLSPPPHLEKSYAMGLFLWDFTESPLVEVRGYANIPLEKAENFSDFVKNVKKLIEKETSWFFDKK